MVISIDLYHQTSRSDIKINDIMIDRMLSKCTEILLSNSFPDQIFMYSLPSTQCFRFGSIIWIIWERSSVTYQSSLLDSLFSECWFLSSCTWLPLRPPHWGGNSFFFLHRKVYKKWIVFLYMKVISTQEWSQTVSPLSERGWGRVFRPSSLPTPQASLHTASLMHLYLWSGYSLHWVV